MTWINSCRELIRDIIIYPHMKCRWNRTILNLCGIVVAILKMATGRNISMSGINSGHHNLPSYEMVLKSVQHCSISSKFDMWVHNDVLNWFPTLKNFYRSPFSKWPPQYRTNSTLCYLWNRTMLNFCGIVAAILKMETGRNFLMSGIISGRWNRTMLNLCGIVAAILIQYISHQYHDLLNCNSSQYILSIYNSQHNNNNNYAFCKFLL
jgi:hypothetical protein